MNLDNIVKSTGYTFIRFDDGKYDAIDASVGMMEGLRGIRISNSDNGIDNCLLSVHIDGNPSKCSVVQSEHNGIGVTVIALANVTAGATRVGNNPQEGKGEILVIAIVDAHMPIEAMVRAEITLTEAVVAAMQDLGIRYNALSATGSVKQNIIIVCNRESDRNLRCAGKHCILGEMLGATTKQAITASAESNGITLQYRKSSIVTLSSYGITQDMMFNCIGGINMRAFIGMLIEKDFDPNLFSSTVACLNVYDQVQWGLIPNEVGKSVVKDILSCMFDEPVGDGEILDVLAHVVAKSALK